jgi:hypothetical protein
MQNDQPTNTDATGETSCLILDVRVVNITGGKDKKKPAAGAAGAPGAGPDVAIEVEPAAPGTAYWTILPLDKKKLPKQGTAAGAQYVAAGTFQLPLFEGPVPIDGDIFAAYVKHTVSPYPRKPRRGRGVIR